MSKSYRLRLNDPVCLKNHISTWLLTSPFASLGVGYLDRCRRPFLSNVAFNSVKISEAILGPMMVKEAFFSIPLGGC